MEKRNSIDRKLFRSAGVLFLLIANLVFAQPEKEVNLKTSISEVTVFLQSALINRKGKITIPQGKADLVISNLSSYIDDKSVQVKGVGDFTILSVNHRYNFLNKLKKDKKTDSLRGLIEDLTMKVKGKESRLQVLQEKQSLMNANKNLGGEMAGASLQQLKLAMDFYDKELSELKAEELKARKDIENWEKDRANIEKQISDIRKQEERPTGEIVIRTEAGSRTEGKFEITYLVSNAGWFPKYDIRVANVTSPIGLTYKAEIYQNTGVDWTNVKLKFSNGNPDQTGVAPVLQTWHLNYLRNTIYRKSLGYSSANTPLINSHGVVSGIVVDAEDGQPLPGVNVVAKGTTVGTVTDVNGYYSLTMPNSSGTLVFSFIGLKTEEVEVGYRSVIDMHLAPDVQQLEEVVVTAQGIESSDWSLRGVTPGIKIAKAIKTTVIENQTTVEFEVDIPYTIKSTGEKIGIELTRYEVPASYQYYAVPKLDKDAFLIARIINWDQYNLLEGEANLYFEDAYVGRSVLDAKSLKDTLDISLGRDKNIVVGRVKEDDFSKRKMIGSNVIETRGFKIIVRNKKSQAIKLTLFDQLPVPAINDISVSAIELSNAVRNEKTGELKWEFDLKPQQQQEIQLKYEVKYPRREKIALE